jgi:predicted Fe-S protein YdhL (DUF1289 family)
LDAVDPNNPYDSPCVRTCVIDRQTGYCLGCARTLNEISYWTRYSPDERRAILQQLPARNTSNSA